MKNLKTGLIAVLAVYGSVQQINAQGSAGAIAPPSPTSEMRGWTDPALQHNKLLQEQTGDGMYKLIGPYKVIGSSFLFGEPLKGDMFSPGTKAYNIKLSYNTYNQEVGFLSVQNSGTPLVKEPGDLDSFIIQRDTALDIQFPMKFIYGSLLGVKDKAYYLELFKGDKFNLYKKYSSELGINTSNILQSELRQFDLNYEYYYAETGVKGLKKIKANANGFIKEFKRIKDLTGLIGENNFAVNPEGCMKTGMILLNAQ
ncbi:MAG: hypothetical protein IPH18_13310 [Chitinophagaceae bacterium]|nr:hypothetical protein [Chitinophagaceae bacterium]MBK8952404.1 hypothetical protein [Chitinophagaceae bacterium]